MLRNSNKIHDFYKKYHYTVIKAHLKIHLKQDGKCSRFLWIIYIHIFIMILLPIDKQLFTCTKQFKRGRPLTLSQKILLQHVFVFKLVAWSWIVINDIELKAFSPPWRLCFSSNILNLITVCGPNMYWKEK